VRRFRSALDDFGYDALQRSLRGGFPRVPFPPYAEFSATLRRLPARQRTWFRLLLLGRRLPARGVEDALGANLVDDLLELEVLHRRQDALDTGGLALVCYRDRYLLASLDASYPTSRDRRLTLYVGPSSYRLADALPLGRTFGSALDLCAGPGLLGIVLGSAAERVVLAELLPEAVAAARFNVALNGLDAKIDVVESDLYARIGRRRFDLVASNPPFVTGPAGTPGAVYADGGADGMRLVGPLVAGLPDHLRADGWALVYLEGPGDRERPFFASRLAAASAGRLAVDLLLLDRITTADAIRQLGEIDRTLRRGRAPHAPQMRRLFREQGASHFYSLLARLRRGPGHLQVTNGVPRGR
jgi:methylase of polypeptide subunit release factors